jgi:WD40 repeat protein
MKDLEAFYHDSSGWDCHRLRIERRESRGDRIGIDILIYPQHIRQKTQRHRRFAGTIRATDDIKMIRNLKLSSDGKKIAVERSKNDVELWNQSNTTRSPLLATRQVLGFSPDSQTLVTQGSESIIKFWLPNGQQTQLTDSRHNIQKILAISPSGEEIVTLSTDKVVQFWNVKGSLIRTLSRDANKTTSIQFSPNGKRLASIEENNTIKIWKSDGTFLKTLPGHFEQVTNIIFSPDRQFIATIGNDNLVDLYQVDGTFVKTLVGHDEPITSVSFSPDSRMLASVSGPSRIYFGMSTSNVIKFWDSRNGTPITTIPANNINSVMFSPKVRNYLKTNPNVSESDRNLCDGIGSQKPEREGK